ncbi:AsmA family protein [Congregibacter sp.]|uniref:AsmA family protein n=1 Tax=Congregibacter sp. TaxID=2744308 RepID=UPI003F6AF93D
MTLSRFVLTFTLAVVVAVAAFTATMRASPEFTLRVLMRATEAFSPYTLELASPRLQWAPFEFQAELLLVNYSKERGPPLISIQRASLAMSLRELLLGDITRGEFSADNVTYYLDDESSDAPIDMEALLAPLSRLPKSIDIASVHLISQSETLWIFPLYDVRASRNLAGSIDLDAAASVANRSVLLDAQAIWKTRGDSHRLELDALISGLEEDSQLRAAGYVDAVAADLRYELRVEGRYERVSDFLGALDANAYPFAGNLSVKGTLNGDLSTYTLSLDEIGLSNNDAYEFTAHGQIEKLQADEISLKLRAKGSAQEMDALVPLEGALGQILLRSEVEMDIAGSLEAPLIQRAALVLYGLGDTRLSLTSQSQTLQLSELGSLSPEQTARVKVDGRIGDLGELLVSTGSLAKDLADTTGLTGATATFTGTAQGNANELRIDLNELLVTNRQFSVNGKSRLLWRENVFSAPVIELQVTDRQGPGTLSASGAIADLPRARGLAIKVDLDEFLSSALLETFDVQLPVNLGPINGEALLLRAADTLRLSEVHLTGDVFPGIVAEVHGTADLFDEDISADLDLRLRARDERAWDAISPLASAPQKVQARMRLRPGYLTMLSDITMGSTHIQGVLSGDVDRRRLERLAIDFYTPTLHLSDFVLRDTGQDTHAMDQTTDIQSFNRSLPEFPLSLTLRSGTVTGPMTELADLSLALDAEPGRLILRELDTRYGDGELIARGSIDSTVTPPAISFAGRGIRVPLGALTKDLGLQQTVTGSLSFQGGLVTRGTNSDAWRSNLQGRMSTALSDVTVSGAAYDLLMSNLLAWLVKGAAEKTTTFDCSMAQFDIKGGVARSDSLYIETPRMLATGKASIDLPQNSLDVRIEPRSKSRAIQFPSAVRLGGDLNNPELSVSALQASADLSAQALLLLPSLTLKLFGLDGPDDLNRPCTTPGY